MLLNAEITTPSHLSAAHLLNKTPNVVVIQPTFLPFFEDLSTKQVGLETTTRPYRTSYKTDFFFPLLFSYIMF